MSRPSQPAARHPCRQPRRRSPRTQEPAIRRIDFLRDKYGPELLIDVGWIRDLPNFFQAGHPHWLSFYDILLVTRGHGRFWLDTRAYPIRRGHLYFTSPGQVRRWDAEDVEGICLFFTHDFMSTFFNDSLFLHRLRFFHNGRDDLMLTLPDQRAAQLLGRLVEMEREVRALLNDSDHLLRAQLYEVLITLNRWFVPSGSGSSSDAPLAWRFRQLVEQRFKETHRVEHYARQLAISPGHLNHLAKQHLGATASEVVRSRILIEAKRLLLHSDDTAASIATALGFEDPSYFSRFFRRETGQAPAAYRREIRARYRAS